MRLQAGMESSFSCIFPLYLPHHTLYLLLQPCMNAPHPLRDSSLALRLAELLPFRVSCPPYKRVEKLLLSPSCLAPFGVQYEGQKMMESQGRVRNQVDFLEIMFHKKSNGISAAIRLSPSFHPR